MTSPSFALPDLELLDWEDSISLSHEAFQTIAQSPINRLKLFRVAVEEKSVIELP